MTPGRLRLLTLAAIAAEAGLIALAWSQAWFDLTMGDALLTVPGADAGGALLPLALASLALVAALAIAGPFFRVVLGVLDAALGLCVLVVSAWAVSDPVRASFATLVDTTGISGDAALRAMVTDAAATPWPVVAIVLGALVILTGLFVTVTSRTWPVSGRRYTRVRAETPDGDPVHDWDALNEGDDPTSQPR
jgi:uncharacterized membrane protein (TIGR02234 family)